MSSETMANPEEPKSKKLSFETVKALKAAGLPKPEGVSWGDWIGPKKFNDRHQLIALLRAQGKTHREIAHVIGINEARLSIILQTERMASLVSHYRDEQFTEGSEIIQRFKNLSDKAIDVLEEAITNPQERTSVKLRAVNEVLNRALGKPKESIEVKTSTVRDLFEELDKLRRGELRLDFSSGSSKPKLGSQSDNIIDTTAEVIKERRDPADDWIEANVPDSVGIGKRGTSEES